MATETVRVKHGDSFLVMNKKDVDGRKHHIIDDVEQKPAKKLGNKKDASNSGK